jgi:hypothetical protein
MVSFAASAPSKEEWRTYTRELLHWGFTTHTSALRPPYPAVKNLAVMVLGLSNAGKVSALAFRFAAARLFYVLLNAAQCAQSSLLAFIDAVLGSALPPTPLAPPFARPTTFMLNGEKIQCTQWSCNTTDSNPLPFLATFRLHHHSRSNSFMLGVS